MSEKVEPDGMLALAIAIEKQEWPCTMDAAKWTDEWLKQVALTPEMVTDYGCMIGWFANAIMAGYDTACSRMKAPK